MKPATSVYINIKQHHITHPAVHTTLLASSLQLQQSEGAAAARRHLRTKDILEKEYGESNGYEFISRSLIHFDANKSGFGRENRRQRVAKHPNTKAFTSCSVFKRLNNNKLIQLHKSGEG